MASDEASIIDESPGGREQREASILIFLQSPLYTECMEMNYCNTLCKCGEGSVSSSHLHVAAASTATLSSRSISKPAILLP